MFIVWIGIDRRNFDLVLYIRYIQIYVQYTNWEQHDYSEMKDDINHFQLLRNFFVFPTYGVTGTLLTELTAPAIPIPTY
jgi:hypothetical protein